MATKCKDRVLMPFDYGHYTGAKHAARRLSRASFRGETAIRLSVAAGSRQSAAPPLPTSDRTVEPLTPSTGNRFPSDHFPIINVDDEDDANDLSIPVPLNEPGDPLEGEPLPYPPRLELCSPGR
jgi:hypothetical protein